MKKISILLCMILVVVALNIIVSAEENIDESALWWQIDEDNLTFDGLWQSIDIESQLVKQAPHKSDIIVNFEGTGIKITGINSNFCGIADIYIDGEFITNVNCFSEDIELNQVLYSEKNLKAGTHELKMMVKGKKAEESNNTYILVQDIKYIPTLKKIVAEVNSILENSQKPAIGKGLRYYFPEAIDTKLREALEKGKTALDKTEIESEELLEIKSNLTHMFNEAKENKIHSVFPDLAGKNEAIVGEEGEPIWVEGKFGNAVFLNGLDDKDDYLYLPNGLLDGETKITIEAWIKPENEDDKVRVVACDKSNVFQLLQGTARLADSEGNFTEFIDGQSPTLYEWQHIAIVYDGENFIYYWNGIQKGSLNIGEITLNSPNEYTAIGINVKGHGRDPGSFGGAEYHGSIDEVRIWNIARTSSEIKENMKKELTGEENGLVAYINFNELKK